jgi:hypothetical protein
MSQGEAPAAARPTPPAPLWWQSWPLREGGAAAWTLLGFIVAMALAAGLTTRSMAWPLVVCGILCLAAWRFFIPVVYEINGLGITEEVFGRRRRIAWRSVRTCEICRQGVFVSTTDGISASWSGLYIPWEGHREQVLALVAYYLRGAFPGSAPVHSAP